MISQCMALFGTAWYRTARHRTALLGSARHRLAPLGTLLKLTQKCYEKEKKVLIKRKAFSVTREIFFCRGKVRVRIHGETAMEEAEEEEEGEEAEEEEEAEEAEETAMAVVNDNNATATGKNNP